MLDKTHAPHARALLSGRLEAIAERAERTLCVDPEAAVDDLLALDALMIQGPDSEVHEARLKEGVQRVRHHLPLSAILLELRRCRAAFMRGGYERALAIVEPLLGRLAPLKRQAPPPRRHHLTSWPPNPVFLWSCAISLRSAIDRAIGETRAAAKRCEALREEMVATGLAAGELNAVFHLGIARCAMGHLDDAEAHLRRALTLSLQVGALRQRANAFSYLGDVAAQRGDTALALGWTMEARQRLEANGDQILVAKLLAKEHRLLIALGDQVAAADRAERGYELGVLCGDFETQANILAAGSIAQRPPTDGAGEGRRAARERALLWDLEALGYDALRRRIDGRSLWAGPHLIINGAVVRVRRGDGAEVVVDLRQRPVLRRVLDRLIDAREQGAEGVSAEALLIAAWPGERPTRSSGLNRVYAAIRLLRRSGLEGILLRDTHGYRLDWPVHRQ